MSKGGEETLRLLYWAPLRTPCNQVGYRLIAVQRLKEPPNPPNVHWVVGEDDLKKKLLKKFNPQLLDCVSLKVTFFDKFHGQA